ncbi:MAG: hypothetical protein Q4B04_00795 [bacterium]|nr:hypothetical protein [bacterium]
MTRNSMSFIKGMGAGVAAGVIITTVGRIAMKDSKSLAKGTGKAVKAVGDIVESIQMMMK